jgi:hypothetical protein
MKVLAVPLWDPQGCIGGVVQVLNRRQGLFSEDDERYLLALAEHAALTAECQRLAFLYRISGYRQSLPVRLPGHPGAQRGGDCRQGNCSGGYRPRSSARWLNIE